MYVGRIKGRQKMNELLRNSGGRGNYGPANLAKQKYVKQNNVKAVWGLHWATSTPAPRNQCSAPCTLGHKQVGKWMICGTQNKQPHADDGKQWEWIASDACDTYFFFCGIRDIRLFVNVLQERGFLFKRKKGLRCFFPAKLRFDFRTVMYCNGNGSSRQYKNYVLGC